LWQKCVFLAKVVAVVVEIGLHDRWKLIIIVEVVFVEIYRIVLVAVVADGVMLVATIKLWW